MPRPKSLPDSGTLAHLRRAHPKGEGHPEGCQQGHTLQQIADIYGVTENAVYRALREAGLTTPRPRYTDTMPWVVASEHEQAYAATMLRELAKRKQGLEPGNKGRYLDRWLERLDAAGQVVAYDREKGFHLVKRRASDGDGYIRKPTKKQLAADQKELGNRRAPSSQPT